jgi:omega-amidase
MKTPVHLVQLDCVWEDKAANFARVSSLLEEARPAPGSLIVLPEMFATGFSKDVRITAESEGGMTEVFLTELASRWKCGVIGGVVVKDKEGACRNQAVFVSEGGEIIGRYSKIQPFTLGGERECHVPGKEVVVMEWSGWKIAPLVCYDLRFPELAREATRMGAEVLVFIASWPARRYQHWLTLLEARAIENQAYVIGVNRCGSDPEFQYPGRSVVVDPHGVIIADAGAQERVCSAVFERVVLEGWRADFPALKDAGIG